MLPIFKELSTPSTFRIPKAFLKGAARFKEFEVGWNDTPISYEPKGEPTIYSWDSISPPYRDWDLRILAYLSRKEWGHTQESRKIARSIFNRVAEQIEKESPLWEGILTAWTRNINEIIFCYLDPRLRPQMSRLTAALDKQLARGDWTDYFLTGSNINGACIGKAAWSAVRGFEDSYKKNIEAFRSWLPLSYPKGVGDKAYLVPSEGPLYGMFALQGLIGLSFVQDQKGLPLEIGRFKKRLAAYYNLSLVEKGRLHTHGDTREHIGWGAEPFIALYAYCEDKQALKFYGNMWEKPPVHYWGEILNKNLSGYVGPATIRKGTEWCYSKEKNQVIFKNDQYTTVLDGGCQFGKYRLHFGLKPTSYSYWSGGWVERDAGYVNPTHNWRDYRDEFNTIEDTKLPQIYPIEQVSYNVYTIGRHKLICGTDKAEVYKL